MLIAEPRIELGFVLQDQGQYVVLWKQGQEVLTAGPMMVKPDPRLRYMSP
jgi:hypothetical protein